MRKGLNDNTLSADMSSFRYIKEDAVKYYSGIIHSDIRCTENDDDVHKLQSHLKYNTITNTPYSTILYPITNN